MQPPSIRTVRPIPITRVQPTPVVHHRRERPIFVSWTRGVSQAEGEAAVSGVRDVLRAANVDWEIRVFGSRTWADGDYGCADWYVERSTIKPGRNRGYGLQANANHICIDMVLEPWQKTEPHYDLMIVNRDLSTGEANNNFVFGATQPAKCSVQSVARLRQEITDPATMLRVLRRLTRHEVGHIFNAATGPNHTENTERSLGQHCINLCCMRQGQSTRSWVAQLAEEERAGILFCANCIQEMVYWTRG